MVRPVLIPDPPFEQDQHVFRGAIGAGRGGSHPLPDLRHVPGTVGRHDENIGEAAGECRAGWAGQPVHQDRMSLRRTGDVQRPGHVEVLPFVVECVQPFRDEVGTRRAITVERVVVEAVPEAGDHPDELRRAGRPLSGIRGRTATIVGHLVVVTGRTHLPARASAAEVVDGGHRSCHVIGRQLLGRDRRHEPDAFARHRQRGGDGACLVHRAPGRVPHRLPVVDQQCIHADLVGGAGALASAQKGRSSGRAVVLRRAQRCEKHHAAPRHIALTKGVSRGWVRPRFSRNVPSE